MDKEELFKRARDPKYISGIYNYCDRWCERCQFTSRCLNCSLDDEQNCGLDERDITNASFCKTVMESLELASSLIEDIAEEEGINLDSIEIERDEDDKTVVHVLSHRSKTYASMVDDCFNTNPSLLESGLRERNANSHLKIIKPQTSEASVSIGDVIEVIRWYQHQIHFKLSRAIKSKKYEENLPLNDFPKDSDGSAKIALIEIDRSISAWGEFLNYFPEQRKNILYIINYLKRLRDITEIEFPNASTFVRPGFDEQRDSVKA
jgi:hypothetical protein